MCKQNLKEFLEHDEESVREAAVLLKDYISMEMSGDEISEIMEDLLELNRIEEHVDSIERKILIEKAFDAIKLIISSIP